MEREVQDGLSPAKIVPHNFSVEPAPVTEPPEEVREFLPGTELPTRPPRMRWYWVTGQDLDSISSATSPDDFGISSFCFATLLAGSSTLFTAPDLRNSHPIFFYALLFCCVVAAFLGPIFAFKWRSKRKQLKSLIEEIKRAQYKDSSPVDYATSKRGSDQS